MKVFLSVMSILFFCVALLRLITGTDGAEMALALGFLISIQSDVL